MATTDSLANVRSQVGLAQNQIAQQESQIQQARANLLKLQQALPDISSQQSLRNKLNSLQGINFRQQVGQTEQQIKNAGNQITNYENATLTPYKKQVAQAQAQIQDYDARVRGFELAKKFYDKGVPYKFVDDPFVKMYLKEMYKLGALQPKTTMTLTTTKPDILGFKVTDLSNGNSILTTTKNGEIVSQVMRDINNIPIPQSPKINLSTPQNLKTDIVKDIGETYLGKQGFQTLKTNLREIGSGIDKDFGLSKGYNFINSGLNKAEQGVYNFINQPTTQERILNSKIQNYETKVKDYETQINNFNSKYSGELKPQEYDQATKDAQRLEQIRNYLEYQGRALDSESKGLNLQRENSGEQVVKSLLSGLATAPIVTAKFLINPVQGIKETYTGIKNLPSSFAEQPATTFGTLVGQTAFNVGLGESFNFGSGAEVTRFKSVTPKVSVSKSFSDSLRVGDINDIDVYLNKAQVTTKRISPKTGRLINEFTTDIRGASAVSNLDDGVIIKSKATAGTTSSRGISVNLPKINAKMDILENKSLAFFKSQPNDSGFIPGTAKSVSKDYGSLRFAVNPRDATLQLTRTRLPEQYGSLSNIAVKPLKTIEGNLGKTQFDFSISKTGTSKTLGKVSRYEKETGTKVSAYLRRNRRPSFTDKNINMGLSRTRTPPGETNFFNPSGGQDLVSSSDFKQGAVKSAFDSQVEAIANVQKAKASKPIVTKIKVEKSGKTIPGASLEVKTNKADVLSITPQEDLINPKEKTTIKNNNSVIPIINKGLIVSPSEKEKIGLTFPNSFPVYRDLNLSKIRDNTKQSQGQSLQLRQQTTQVLSPNLSKTNTLTRPTRPTQEKPPKKIKINLPGEDRKKKVFDNLKIKNRPETFFGITKVRGKEKVVSVGKNPFAVINQAKRNVLNTLSASVRVVSNFGRELRLTPDRFFKQSKRNPDVLVQRIGGRKDPLNPTGRLTTKGERLQIEILKKARNKNLLSIY